MLGPSFRPWCHNCGLVQAAGFEAVRVLFRALVTHRCARAGPCTSRPRTRTGEPCDLRDDCQTASTRAPHLCRRKQAPAAPVKPRADRVPSQPHRGLVDHVTEPTRVRQKQESLAPESIRRNRRASRFSYCPNCPECPSEDRLCKLVWCTRGWHGIASFHDVGQ
jgi:hypothetical protein